jgi:hypothetical protein
VTLAAYKDLCIDAGDASRLGGFWAQVLDLTVEPNPSGVARLVGQSPQHTIWLDEVPERKTAKHRVHLDVYARSLADLEALGAIVVEPQRDGWGWTVMADPEGGEFCAFLRDELPPDRLHGLVVDCADPQALATWWGHVYGAAVEHGDAGHGDAEHGDAGSSTVSHVPGMPILTFDMNRVPEPKTVKNRIHWDVVAPDVDALVARGATVLRRPDDDIRWTVMADPEGNEFCAFAPASS